MSIFGFGDGVDSVGGLLDLFEGYYRGSGNFEFYEGGDKIKRVSVRSYGGDLVLSFYKRGSGGVLDYRGFIGSVLSVCKRDRLRSFGGVVGFNGGVYGYIWDKVYESGGLLYSLGDVAVRCKSVRYFYDVSFVSGRFTFLKNRGLVDKYDGFHNGLY